MATEWSSVDMGLGGKKGEEGGRLGAWMAPTKRSLGLTAVACIPIVVVNGRFASQGQRVFKDRDATSLFETR